MFYSAWFDDGYILKSMKTFTFDVFGISTGLYFYTKALNTCANISVGICRRLLLKSILFCE